MASLRRSQSERAYSRQRYDTATADANAEQWPGVKQAWQKNKDAENGKIREEERKNMLRRIVSYVLKKLRLKRKNRRLVDLNEEDLVYDIESELSKGSRDSVYYSVNSSATLEENIALKNELKQKDEEMDCLRNQKDKEIEYLHQRIKELETQQSLRYSESKSSFIINEANAVNIHVGEVRSLSNSSEEPRQS